jgi:hypothetical protein
MTVIAMNQPNQVRHPPHNLEVGRSPHPRLPRLLPALLLFWRRQRVSLATGDPWEHALPESSLRDAGLNEDEIRWLIDRQCIDYATLADPPPVTTASSQRGDSSSPPPRYFILTEAGAALMFKLSQSFAGEYEGEVASLEGQRVPPRRSAANEEARRPPP